MANKHTYNLGRFDLHIDTPRTTRYNYRRRRLERDDLSDSSIENQRWRDNYAQVADLLHEVNNTSDSDGSTASQSLSGSPVSMPVLSPTNESESSMSPADQIISSSSGSSNHGEGYPRDQYEQLLYEQDDDYASDEDIIEYQPDLEILL
ncbi:uncharacterized protein LOC131664149 [Phymastichus coffea]|uniref:uncharacterized protein LOC131664149 n=1 Tax=Phymastichus coffea TaxID=108790 RepID=UPI00273B41BA|nr:uncharacterized protein LOC131664149 [Phymastichus coffea]